MIQPTSSLDFVMVAVGVVGLIGLYFAPAITAYWRGHPQAGAITVLNLLLGWTLLGWVGALVWSCTNWRQS